MGKGRHLVSDSDAAKTPETEKLPVSVRSEAGGEEPPLEGVAKEGEEPQKQNGGAGPAEEETPENYVPPPDGGWGWVVVFASFAIHVIADGVVYSFGVFLIEFVEYFNAGRGAASWVGSLQPAVTYTVGPLSSALTNRYGCRFVTVLGAVIAGIGFVISMFAPNLYYLYFSAGIMAGVGFGLIYLPAIVCVAQYFEKRRSFATGLAVCGSGFGTFILAPITKHLVQLYSWRGTFLILGGVILNVIACGIVFRPLEAKDSAPSDGDSHGDNDKGKAGDSQDDQLALLSLEGKKEEEEDGEKEATTTTAALELTETGSKPATVTTGEARGDGKLRGEGEGEGLSLNAAPLKSLSNGGLTNVNKNHQHKGAPNGLSTSEMDTLVSSLTFEITTPTDSPSSELFPSDAEGGHAPVLTTSQYLILPGRESNGKDLAQIAASDGALHRLHPQAAVMGGAGGRFRAGGTHVRRRLNSHGSDPPSTPRLLARKDIFYSGSLLNIPMYKSNPDLYIAAVTPLPDASQRSLATEATVADKCACLDLMLELRSTLKEMLSFSLLKNPVFLMFAISNFFTSIGFNMPFIFLPDRAVLAGIDERKAAFLLSVIGIANTCGRVVFGFLSDRSWVNRLFLYNTALTICGVATACSPLVGGDYGFLVAYAVVFGMFIGVYVSLTSVVLVDLLGLEYLTNSFGLLLLFQGAATFIGPPIAGWIYDWTGSYDISFILMGSLIALSGAMLYLLPFVERRYSQKVPKENIAHDVELGKHAVKDVEDDNPQQQQQQENVV